MILVDTSIWIALFRDRTGKEKSNLKKWTADDDVVLTRFNQLELLQGCKDEKEWKTLARYLDAQDYVETTNTTWSAAARIYFDLRRQGKTVQSPVDCCIAQLAIESDALLIHRDVDFETIAAIRPLKHLKLSGVSHASPGRE